MTVMETLKEIEVDADISKLPELTSSVEEFLELSECPMKVVFQVNVAIDEIFSNIVYYAYPDIPGKVKVKVTNLTEPQRIRLTFIDSGVPYDPTAKDDPDITLSAKEREIGGLGIFMVKKTMDRMEYAYEEGQNILTIEKSIANTK